MEMFELHIKQEQIVRRKEKHKKHLSKIFEYTREAQDYFNTQRKVKKKMSHNVKMRHEYIEKKNRRNVNSESKRRTIALEQGKDKDYVQMLMKDAKNNRILKILSETDNYLKEILAKIISIKRSEGEVPVNIDEDVNNWLNEKTSKSRRV